MLCNDSGMNESDSHILYSMPCENTTCVCVRVCVRVREVGGPSMFVERFKGI